MNLGAFNSPPAAYITLAMTRVEQKIYPPRVQPKETKPPPFIWDACKEWSISGDPLAKAINETAAIVGLILKRTARSAIPSDKYFSAICLSYTKSMGNTAIIIINIRGALPSIFV